MRLAVVASDPGGPVARHRVRALEPALRDAGFDAVDVHGLPRRVRARRALFGELAAADLVLLVRKLFTAPQFGALRRAARRLVFDLDDAVLFRDPWRGRPASRVRRARFRRTVRGADAVTAGNDVLLALVREHAPDTPARRAPTLIDTARYRPAAPTEEGPGTRIGWIGSRATRPYLRGIAAPLARLAGRRPDLVLAVLADAPPDDLPGVPLEFLPWSEADEVPFLTSLDVGVMPLTDDPFSRGKCGFKLLQYLACGVPAVASPVGVNRALLAGGVGRLAAGPEEWERALDDLLGDADARRRMARAGRARVEAEWSVAARGPEQASFLAAVARGGRA